MNQTDKVLYTAAVAARRSWQSQEPCRLVYGVASLPLGAPVELEVIFELAG
jgi:enamine deaminase RidA (YjgF/YER057c/UK114 family)